MRRMWYVCDTGGFDDGVGGLLRVGEYGERLAG